MMNHDCNGDAGTSNSSTGNSLDDMRFTEVCGFFNRVSGSTVKSQKTEKVNKFLKHCRDNYSMGEDGLFPLARLLIPQLDQVRGAYGVKEHSLAKIYIRVLCLQKDGLDAIKLLKYRTPTAGAVSGDFADVVFWVLKNRCETKESTLTIRDINKHLDTLADIHAKSVAGGFDKEITKLLLCMSAVEQKWLIRLLLKDLRLGVGTNGLLYSVHPDAKICHDLCNNLNLVCTKLKNPAVRLHELEVELFQHCRPMLAERCDVTQLEKAFSKKSELYVETKLDGERFQVHIHNGKFKYYSRKGTEYTDSFGENEASGILTPKIAKLLSKDLVSAIFDGEMMGWDYRLNCFGSKAMKFDVKHLREGSDMKPCFCVFDLLYYNGEVFTNKPLFERLGILEKLFTPEEGVMVHPFRKFVSSRQEVIKALNNAIDAREEGIILKDPQSVYKPNDRKGGWHKIKPEYTDGLMDELDLLIIGGYYGSGTRKANISHFLLGVAVPPTEAGADPKEFHSVGRVGSGYSYAELAELLQKLSGHWRKVRHGIMPPGLCWTKERPDVWIEPKYSHILQVKATEIVSGDAYKTNYTLRFPRVEKVRYDKPWTDCLTTEQFEDLRKKASGKLAVRHAEMSADSEPEAKRVRSHRSTPTLAAEFRPADLSDVKVKSRLLAGKEICVISGNAQITKQELETKIAQYGGKVVQHRGTDTFCAVAGKVDVRVTILKKEKICNVVKVDWLLRALDTDSETLIDWSPTDLLATSAETEEKFKQEYDEFGDSYTEYATEESLKRTLEQVKAKGREATLKQEDYEMLDDELYGSHNPYAPFRSCLAFFPSQAEDCTETRYRLTSLLFRFGRGRISDSITDEVTHVILNPDDIESKGMVYKSLNHDRIHNKMHLVTYEWVKDCFNLQERLSEKVYYY